MSHVLLHVALCNAVARLSSDATVAMHVRLSYRQGPHPLGVEFDKVFKFVRGSEPETIVEFDAPRGLYRLDIATVNPKCAAMDYESFFPDLNREFSETLSDDPKPPAPLMLLQGAAPSSFLYARPTFVLFDAAQACNQPVSAPLDAHVSVENDRDGYYARFAYDPNIATRNPVIALRISTPTHQFHYVRIKVPYPAPEFGWPSVVHFDVSEDQMDALATEKTDTLLCPKIWTTSVPG